MAQTHYHPYGGTLTHSTNQGVQTHKFIGKELDTMHGLNMYDFGARQLDPTTGLFTSMDPLCEKYYNISPYSYCAGNPINRIDPDGRDAVAIIDIENNIITIKANYYVETQTKPSIKNYSGRSVCPGYSNNDIQQMNEYNNYLNNLNLAISEGEFNRYLLKFDLSFCDGGDNLNCKETAANDSYEGINIGNSIEVYDETRRDFRQKENGDVIGGFTQESQNIIMNYSHDNKMNRIHEIFHTFGLEHSGDPSKLSGIMKYPPQTPNQQDANNTLYNPYMSERRFYK